MMYLFSFTERIKSWLNIGVPSMFFWVYYNEVNFTFKKSKKDYEKLNLKIYFHICQQSLYEAWHAKVAKAVFLKEYIFFHCKR